MTSHKLRVRCCKWWSDWDKYGSCTTGTVLKAAYIIHGNCKNVMNMSQSDQVELWRSIVNGNIEPYIRISSKLKLGILVDEFSAKLSLSSPKSRQKSTETDAPAALRAGRIPVRMYIWNVDKDFDDLEDAPSFDSWDNILYINRPVEINEEGKPFTLHDAIKSLLPEFFADNSLTTSKICKTEGEEEQTLESEAKSTSVIAETSDECAETCSQSDSAEIKLLRIQGIQPKLEIPFAWVVNNLMNPEHFLHICAFIKVPEPLAI